MRACSVVNCQSTPMIAVALLGPRLDLALELGPDPDSSVQALTGEHAQFDLGDVEPTAVLGRVVDLQRLARSLVGPRGPVLALIHLEQDPGVATLERTDLALAAPDQRGQILPLLLHEPDHVATSTCRPPVCGASAANWRNRFDHPTPTVSA